MSRDIRPGCQSGPCSAPDYPLFPNPRHSFLENAGGFRSFSVIFTSVDLRPYLAELQRAIFPRIDLTQVRVKGRAILGLGGGGVIPLLPLIFFFRRGPPPHP